MWTWIVGAVVVCITGLAVYKAYKDRKRRSACGSCCENCSAYMDCPESGES